MSIKTVAAAIQNATNDQLIGPFGGHVDAKEAQAIVDAAVYGKDGKRLTPVTKGEVKQVQDLFDRRPPEAVPGMMHTMAIPENPGAVTFEAEAASTIKAFLVQYGVTPDVPQRPSVNDATRRKLDAALADLNSNGANWSNAASSLPIGLRFERVDLGGDNFPDGFGYTAWIPVGAMRPGMPASDPNDASYAFIQRSGGFAGLNQVVRVSLEGDNATQAA